MKRFPTVIFSLCLLLAAPASAMQSERAQEFRIAYAEAQGPSDAATKVAATPAGLDVEDVTLQEALIALQRASGIPVAYSPTLIPAEKLVTCRCADSTVEAALDVMLAGTGFEFVTAGGQLVVRQETASPTPAAAQDVPLDPETEALTSDPAAAAPAVTIPAQGTVAGRVVSTLAARPLDNVQVSIPSLQMGALTNQAGRFLILNVPVGEYEIRAERIGYQSGTQTVEVTEGGVTEVDFALAERAVTMEGMVVTGVAAQTPQSQVPFTVERVAAADMQHVAQPSVGGMLQSKVPGVKVVQGSGLPGSEPSFLFRGPTSITGSQAPLIVVDGVITQGGIADLNTEDIESMEVVKGAAAAALYGSRAQAGVLQITTKSGAGMTEGETQITLRTTFEAHEIENYMGVNGGNPWRTDNSGNFLNADGDVVALPAQGRAIALDDGEDGTNSQRAFADKEYPPPTFNPQEQFLNPGNRLKTNISARGNVQGTQYFVSGAYEREQGVITLIDPMEQVQARLNLTQPIGDNFELGLTSYISDRDRNLTEEGGGFVEGAGRQGNFIRQITFLTPKANLLTPDPDEPGGISAIGEPIDVGNVSTNPVNRLINTTHEENRMRFMGGANATYNPLTWLSVTGNLSYDRIDQDRFRFQRPGLSNLFGSPPTVGSILQEGSLREELNASLTLGSNQTFGDLTMRNRFRWLMERLDDNRFVISGDDLAVDQTPSLANLTGTPTVASREQSIRSEGFFLINQFSYKERYVGDFLIRRDGSSLFGEDERWQTYGRLSMAWRVSQEPWFDVDWITELKPRYSIGTSGGRPSFSAQYETFAIDQGNVIPTTLGNASLKPELATEQEFGIDVVIANRVQATVNYVDTKVEDQLLLVPLVSAQGFEAQWQNAGTLESDTWEVSLEAAIVENQNMRWTTRVTADRTKNQITELNRPAFEVTNPGLSRSRMMIREGETLGSFYGFQFLGSCDDFAVSMPCDQFDVNDYGHLVWVGAGNTWQDGIANDLWGTTGTVNGETFDWGMPIRPSTENPLSFTKIGESQPDLNLAFRNDFDWGNFGATVLLDGEFGAQIYNFSEQWQCRDWHCAIADQRGVPEGEKKPLAYFARLQAGNGANDFFAQDADYIKLREISVRYRVPDRFLSGPAGGVQRATINLTGRNLVTWTDYRGFDPEVGTDSFLGSAVVGRVDEWSIPNFRSFGVDVELVF